MTQGIELPESYQTILSPVEDLQQVLWKNNLRLFSEDALEIRPPDFLETPEYMDDWYRVLSDRSIKRLLRLAPRSHAKSQVHTINYAAQEIYNNPEVRIVVASNTGGMATGFVSEVRQRLEGSDIFSHLIPTNQRTAKWTDDQFIVNRKRKDKRNPTMLATGANSSILSKRCDILICDDIIDEENSRTEGQREKVRTWFWKTLMPILEPKGRLIMVGTRWHYADLYGELLGAADGRKYPFNEYFKHEDYLCIVQQAILNEEHKKTLWPNRWDYDTLNTMRSKNTAIFNCQYQNDPSGLKGQKFQWDWFKWYTKDGNIASFTYGEGIVEEDIGKMEIYIGIDPAISQKNDADYFALVVIGIDSAGRVFVLDYVNQRMTFNAQIETIFAMIAKWHPIRIGLETKAYQQALKQEIDRISTDKRLYVTVKSINTSVDKVTRSSKLSGMFESGLIYLQRDTQGELTDCLLQFPKGAHDDLFDGLDFAIEASGRDEPESGLTWI